MRRSRVPDSHRPGPPLTERRATIDGVGETVTVRVTATVAASTEAVTAVAIPYFQWDNRDPGPMRVWMPAP